MSVRKRAGKVFVVTTSLLELARESAVAGLEESQRRYAVEAARALRDVIERLLDGQHVDPMEVRCAEFVTLCRFGVIGLNREGSRVRIRNCVRLAALFEALT